MPGLLSIVGVRTSSIVGFSDVWQCQDYRWKLELPSIAVLTLFIEVRFPSIASIAVDGS